MSTLFVRTLREDPSDAEVASHRLLVRAGYIRRVAPGGFAWLPLGLAVLAKVEHIVREEMLRAGFQEVAFPALLPREPYEVSNRWTDYGPNIFRLKDRRDNDFLLAPTHEEMFTLLVKDLFTSYKDLPVSLFQVQTKYRDEARPRAGLLRGREFVMKDSYSFDLDDEGLGASYRAHRDAYEEVFARLGMPYVIVSAVSGAMGGSASEEFLVPLEAGEDTFVRCPSCGYAANTEAASARAPSAVDHDDAPAAHVEDTPATPTIDTLVAHLEEAFPGAAPGGGAWTAAHTLKNVLVMLVHPDGTREPLAIGVPGDREVDTDRLAGALEPIEVTAFTAEDFAAHPTLVRGYIGPGALGSDRPSGIRYLVDPRVVDGTRWVTGADADGRHVLDLVAGRDFTADGTIEAADVRDGDPCPTCGGALEVARGVEMGHIFQLGRRYADALGLRVLDESGQQVTPTMGSYGIGVTRAVAVLTELYHDDLGLVWPHAVAPADVHVVVAGRGDEHSRAAESLTVSLEAAGLEVLLDDREGVRPGPKFKDAELLGMPIVVVVGRGLSEGVLEVRDRLTGDRDDVPVAETVDHVTALASRTDRMTSPDARGGRDT